MKSANEMSGRRAIALLGMLTIVLFNGCQNRARMIHAIAIQPIDFTDTSGLVFLQKEIAGFFHCPVYILGAATMPPAFQNTSKGDRYSADSVLSWLGRRKADSVSILVGLTRKDIFITERDTQGRVREPMAKYAVWGILGLGNCPGSTCVVSDARFYSFAPGRYEHRLRTLLLHEIGHNLGLRHCKTPHCIMNDANEQIATIDSSGNDYCVSCRRAIGL